VLLPLGRKQHPYVQGHLLCLHYTLCLMQLSVVRNLILKGPRTIPREWIFSHRCSWISVYVFCRNAESESHSDPHDICTLSLLYQLPNCNLFNQHVLFILWRDTASELWTSVQFSLHCYTVLLLLTLFTFLHTIILLPLGTLNLLFTANRWDWQPYRKLGAKFLVVLCAGFTLLLGEDTPTIFLAPLSGVSRS
jgi:hypothetical protein